MRPIGTTRGRESGKMESYLIMTIQLQVFLDLHRILLRLGRLRFDSLRDIGQDFLGSEHAVGVQTTVVGDV